MNMRTIKLHLADFDFLFHLGFTLDDQELSRPAAEAVLELLVSILNEISFVPCDDAILSQPPSTPSLTDLSVESSLGGTDG